MKKIFIKTVLFLILFFGIIGYSKAQLFTESIDTARETTSSLYGISNMGVIFTEYNIAILCDSALKVGTNADMTEYATTKAGQWTYLGFFKSATQTDLWVRKYNSEATAVNVSFVIWGK